jgi:hypothetical protein
LLGWIWPTEGAVAKSLETNSVKRFMCNPEPSSDHSALVSTMRIAFLIACLMSLSLTKTGASPLQDPQQIRPLHSADTLDLLREEVLDTISLDRDIHFTTPYVTSAIAQPETYRVSEAGTNSLRLKDTRNRRTHIIDALPTNHDEAITTPVALYIQDDEKFPHVLLLLPGGRALEAVGSYDQIRSRATRSSPISADHLHAAFKAKVGTKRGPQP